METLRSRLIGERRSRGLTQSQLAKKACMSQAAYQKLESGQSERSRFIADIAQVLGVNAEWLAHGGDTPMARGENFEERQPTMAGMAPEISWVQAGCWTDSCHAEYPQDAERWHPRPSGSSDKTFVLRVVGESMCPDYPPGRLIFVDPERPPESGDDVIAVMTDSGESTFKRFIEEPGSGRMLKAINPDWRDPYISINGNCSIAGVIVADMRIR